MGSPGVERPNRQGIEPLEHQPVEAPEADVERTARSPAGSSVSSRGAGVATAGSRQAPAAARLSARIPSA